MQIRLPGRAEPLDIPSPGWADRYPPPASRRVYAAAHVAARPGPDGEVIDWESTMAFRDHLWAYGFGVAEAMDTAQRGMGLSWEQASELIVRSAARAAGGWSAGLVRISWPILRGIPSHGLPGLMPSRWGSCRRPGRV